MRSCETAVNNTIFSRSLGKTCECAQSMPYKLCVVVIAAASRLFPEKVLDGHFFSMYLPYVNTEQEMSDSVRCPMRDLCFVYFCLLGVLLVPVFWSKISLRIGPVGVNLVSNTL